MIGTDLNYQKSIVPTVRQRMSLKIPIKSLYHHW